MSATDHRGIGGFGYCTECGLHPAHPAFTVKCPAGVGRGFECGAL